MAHSRKLIRWPLEVPPNLDEAVQRYHESQIASGVAQAWQVSARQILVAGLRALGFQVQAQDRADDDDLARQLEDEA